MNYFKYRSVDLDHNGEITKKCRDETLQPLIDSYFYLPTIDKLNDPFEGLYVDHVQPDITGMLQGVTAIGERQEIARQLYGFSATARKFTESSGIFSLSSNPVDELMWAHYSDSHYGMMIEYDFDLLTRFVPSENLYSFPVTYDSVPPEVRASNLTADNGSEIKARLGNKSLAWEYEAEYRIAIDNMSGGVSHDYRAIKSITFGARTSDEIVNEIIDLTKYKVIEYYQIETADSGYGLTRNKLNFVGSQPTKSKAKLIDFKGHLGDLESNQRLRVLVAIENHLLADPHFTALNIADACIDHPELIFVTFDCEHGLGLPPQFEGANKIYFSSNTLGIVDKEEWIIKNGAVA